MAVVVAAAAPPRLELLQLEQAHSMAAVVVAAELKVLFLRAEELAGLPGR